MRTKSLMKVQLISLLTTIISANTILDSFVASAIFIISFSVFAICSIYISKNSDKLLREIDNYYRKENAT